MRKSLLVAGAAGAALAGVSMSSSQAGSTGPALFTAAQVSAGSKTYAANCSTCHGTKLEGISAPALTGTGNGLEGESVGAAYTFISTQMPAGSPGSLSGKEYTNIIAFILSKNGHAPGPTALTPAAAKKSTIKV